MKIFHFEHNGHCIRGDSIVIAKNEEEAIESVKAKLKKAKIFCKIYSITEINLKEEKCIMINNGNY